MLEPLGKHWPWLQDLLVTSSKGSQFEIVSLVSVLNRGLSLRCDDICGECVVCCTIAHFVTSFNKRAVCVAALQIG